MIFSDSVASRAALAWLCAMAAYGIERDGCLFTDGRGIHSVR